MKCNINCPYSKYNGKNRNGTQDIICHSAKWFMDSSKDCIEGYTEEQMEQLKKLYPSPPKERYRVFTDIENKEEVIVDLDEIPTDDYNVVRLSLEEVCDLLNKQDEEIEHLKTDLKQQKIVIDSLKDQNQKLKLRLKDLGVEYYD